MAHPHPVIWPKKTFYYPIGNTPPVCLTQDLSPGKPADILLLGSGDPRNILYTIYADLSPEGRRMDFTCCDWEPAVLARNIILLTMIFDGVKPSDAWPIFFHFFLDDHSYTTLRTQCSNLVQAAVDMNTWRKSSYGQFIGFCTEQSLIDIRRHWVDYLNFETLSVTEKKAINTQFTSGMKSVREQYGVGNLSSLRSAGPLSPSMLDKGSRYFASYWTSGTAPSNTNGSLNKPLSHLNPTFVYSMAGRRFNVHYGTDPLLAFHLASTLASKKHVTIEDLTDGCQAQFSTWCISFKVRISNTQISLKIRFFVGEALSFCRALRSVAVTQDVKTGIYSHPWSASQIIFDEVDYFHSEERAPLSFSIIDTSNLSDHTGLLNLLVSAVPLLRREPWAVLHTHALIRTHSTVHKEIPPLDQAIFSDITTLALLLGVTPSSHMWHFTMNCNTQEKLYASLVSGQSQDITSWRFHSNVIAPIEVAKLTCDYKLEAFRVSWDSKDLASYLFSLYLQMFSDENQAENFRNIGNLSAFHKMSNIHYTRGAYAAFLALIKERVCVNWSDTMNRLIDFVAQDRSFLMGSNNFQDLMCHLTQRGLHTLTVFQPDYLESVRSDHDKYNGWKSIPPVVCIVLTIPREKLRPLEEMDADKIMTPIVQCESISWSTPGAFHNIHSSVQLLFGKAITTYVDGEPQVTIKQDDRGWNGTSDLIASVYIPAWILTVDPAATRFGLFIRNTPMSIKALANKLGFQLTIYSTLLTDSEHLQVTRHRPNNLREIGLFRQVPISLGESPDNTMIVSALFDSSKKKVTALVTRKTIENIEAINALRQGAEVVTRDIGDSVFRIAFGPHSYDLNLPISVYGRHVKTRIARKSSYIEIEAPVRTDYSDFNNMSMSMFPMIRHSSNEFNLLNIHYVNLDVLPALSLPTPVEHLEWLPVHARTVFSDEEYRARNDPDQTKQGVLVQLKESIVVMLLKFAGLQLDPSGYRPTVIGLSNPDDGGIHTLLFINELKFDLDHHTLVLDACVVPLTTGIMDKLVTGIQTLLDRRRFLEVYTQSDEARAWRLLWPCLAERCRTWKHTKRCEYMRHGIPVAMEGPDASPLCSCGKGKNLGTFGNAPEWRVFWKEATRVAIGPLFSFAFPKDFNDTVKERMENLSMNIASCARCGGAGKPSLQHCSVCKKTQYCSRECQKADWKMHKKTCTAA